MKSQTAAGIEDVLSGKIQLPADVKTLAEQYRNAQPYPHLVLDDLFSGDLLRQVLSEMPSLEKGDWVELDEEHLKQYNMSSVVQLGEAGQALVALLHSAAFLYFLSEVTGIWNLLPDPYMQGAAFHVMPSGGHFGVHVDRNTAYEVGLYRRLALIIYLNEGWQHEYGGQLELWDKQGTRCEAVVEPNFNRSILFEIDDKNFHGVPNAVAHPRGDSRKSFMAYYHTAKPIGAEAPAPHTSIYAPSFYRNESPVRKFIRAVTPPVLLEWSKGVRKKY